MRLFENYLKKIGDSSMQCGQERKRREEKVSVEADKFADMIKLA